MRTEARIYTSRSADLDWTMLPYGPQWLYDQLLSQDDLEHHGVIALRPARWAQLATDMTEPLLLEFLDMLAQRRFVIVDPAYGEVFVRTLIRGDKIYRQPNILRSAADRLGQVKSPLIRDALHAELERIAELPDLTETCALIVTEMLQATQPGAPAPERRPRPRAAAKPSGSPATKASGQASPDTSGTGRRSPTDKASAYRPAKESGEQRSNGLPTPVGAPASKSSGKGSGKGSPAPSGNPGGNGSGMAADAVSPDLRPKAPGKGSGNSSDNPSTQGQPQTTPDPLPAPNADAADQHRQASRQILATWLRSTGSRMPEAGLVAAVERVLADALRAGEPTERVTDVLAHWQQEDGTDPARLTTMIGNASDTRASDRPATAAGGAATANPKPLGGWELKDLEAATVAVTNPWLATLAVKPTDEMLEDIEYHISSAFIAGHRHERLAAALAAWHASGSTDPWHLADLIDNWPTVIETQPPDDPQAADRGAREWLTYAPKATA